MTGKSSSELGPNLSTLKFNTGPNNRETLDTMMVMETLISSCPPIPLLESKDEAVPSWFATGACYAMSNWSDNVLVG